MRSLMLMASVLVCCGRQHPAERPGNEGADNRGLEQQEAEAEIEGRGEEPTEPASEDCQPFEPSDPVGTRAVVFRNYSEIHEMVMVLDGGASNYVPPGEAESSRVICKMLKSGTESGTKGCIGGDVRTLVLGRGRWHLVRLSEEPFVVVGVREEPPPGYVSMGGRAPYMELGTKGDIAVVKTLQRRYMCPESEEAQCEPDPKDAERMLCVKDRTQVCTEFRLSGSVELVDSRTRQIASLGPFSEVPQIEVRGRKIVVGDKCLMFVEAGEQD